MLPETLLISYPLINLNLITSCDMKQNIIFFFFFYATSEETIDFQVTEIFMPSANRRIILNMRFIPYSWNENKREIHFQGASRTSNVSPSDWDEPVNITQPWHFLGVIVFPTWHQLFTPTTKRETNRGPAGPSVAASQAHPVKRNMFVCRSAPP